MSTIIRFAFGQRGQGMSKHMKNIKNSIFRLIANLIYRTIESNIFNILSTVQILCDGVALFKIYIY